MASTQKKLTSNSRRSASSGSAKKKSNTASKSKAKKSTAKKQQPKPFRRGVWAIVCFLLAIFSAFGYVKMDAVFITFFCGIAKGLIGYGFLLLPPALLLACFILAFHHGRPVRLRVACALLLPVVFGCIAHGLLVDPLPWDGALRDTLWSEGQSLRSGGLISGALAQLCVKLFTSLGCTVLFALIFFILALGAFRLSLADLASWLYNRPKYEPTPRPERPKTPAPEPRRPKANPNLISTPTAPVPRRRGRTANIDIPMATDFPETPPQQEPKIEKPEPVTEKEPSALNNILEKTKHNFFDRDIKVPTPDQMFQNMTPDQNAAVPEEPEDPVPATEGTVSAPEREKITKAEQAQAVQEITHDIQQSMDEDEEAPYYYPPLSLLKEETHAVGSEALSELNANKQRLSDTIHSFGIDANIVNVTRGPSVTRYELELDQGVRLNKLTNLADDIALALGAAGVRIAPIPDQISMVGIEVPNKLVTPVNIHDVIGSNAFTNSKSKVSFALGKDIGGSCIVGNIAKLPHLLIAGTTGSGKSVCTNSLIISLLYKSTPEEVRLIMVDPKMVELGIYNGIPHLLIPVVTDPKKAAGALQWAVTEMMKRYRTFAEVGVRDLASYNAKAAQSEELEKMPQIVVIIDELADLMLVAAKEVEESICRVAQMGRASGMHLVIATQRPSADVITGLMKANIPSRIAFAVASAMESRIILDTQGAEKLVGRGDMLFFPLGAGKPTRVQGCFISDQEVAQVVEFVKRSGNAQYDDGVLQEIEQHAAEKEKNAKGIGGSAPENVSNEFDELIDAAAEVILETGQASVSMLQRRLKLGYARAARLVDQLEEKGIVGPFEGSKPRQLLITKEQWQEMKCQSGSEGTSGVPDPLIMPPEPLPEEEPFPEYDQSREETL